MVKEALLAAHDWGDDAVEIRPVVASGDKIQDRALAEVGGKALWTKELDAWLAAGETDLSVHSMKDVETIRPDIFAIAAMLPRADVRDRLIGAESLEKLAKGARVGTSAPRRRAQLLRARPDLEIVLFRGNVQTRLAKLERGEADATLLAAAGLVRLGMDEGTAVPIGELLPAPSQGAIGIEIRNDDEAARSWIAAIDHRATHDCVDAERALLAELSGDCRSPVAALAEMEGERIWLRAHIYSPDGDECVTGEIEIATGDDDAPARLAQQMLADASPAILAAFGR